MVFLLIGFERTLTQRTDSYLAGFIPNLIVEATVSKGNNRQRASRREMDVTVELSCVGCDAPDHLFRCGAVMSLRK